MRRPLLVFAMGMLMLPMAHAADSKSNDSRAADAAIRYRQSVYQLVVWNFKQMGAMVRGQKPYDDKEMQTRAMRVAALSGMIEEGFAPGTAKGNAMTEAKAEIWQNMDDFKLKLKDFQRESNQLWQYAKAKDAEKVKAQFDKVGGTCKACHDQYKVD